MRPRPRLILQTLGLALLTGAPFLAAQQPAESAVRAWIQANAIPLASVEAGRGFADLEPLRRVVGDARIVALGEATHGTREFFQLKHRMLEFLVSELGFDVFAIEASLPEALAVNRYILTGEGDPERALAGMYFWTWDTEEVLELIRWMRRYNADARHTRKVSFYGIDMQFQPRAARTALDYLRRVDPAALEAVEPVLGPVADPFLARHAGSWPAERKRSALVSLRELAERFDARRDAWAGLTSAAEWDLARRHVHVLVQAAEALAPDASPFAVRDSAMAANLIWALERHGPGSKAVLWAHNGHVATSQPATGWHLRKWLGDGLRVFGFAFERGEFQARDVGTDGTLRVFRVAPAPQGTLEGELAAAGLTLAGLDLRDLPESGPVAEWFRAPLRTRGTGSGYSERNPEWYWSSARVAELYDALFFVRETSAARANPTGRRPAEPLLAAPLNLDFEEGVPGVPPVGWTRPAGIADLEWRASLTPEGARKGRQAVVVRPAPVHGYGDTAAELQQRVDASAWRGRRLTLRASARVEATDPAARAYLWLRVTRPSDTWPETVFYDYMADRPITAADWREYEITADVPADADAIAYGFAFVGEGSGWLDGVVLEGGAPRRP